MNIRNKSTFFSAPFINSVKSIEEIKPLNYPTLMLESFELLKFAGAEYFALFGGAVRDADYGAYHNQVREAKDYDFRIWLPNSNYDTQAKEFINQLAAKANAGITEISADNYKLRYSLNFKGVELDISIRPIPRSFEHKPLLIESVAIDRALDSDIGLCSIAIDTCCRTWATPEYTIDKENKSLTVYPSEDKNRIQNYSQRMANKFKDHTVVLFSGNPKEKSSLSLAF
jgi:hypothetical protein